MVSGIASRLVHVIITGDSFSFGVDKEEGEEEKVIDNL